MSDLLDAISNLHQRMDERFDHIETKVDTKFDGLDKRVTAVESDITRFKTVGGVVGAAVSFLGLEHIQKWINSLPKS